MAEIQAKLKAEIKIIGLVQGVGFRPFVLRLALQNRICGSVVNEGGHVLIEAYGVKSEIELFLSGIREHSPTGSLIRSIKTEVSEFTGVSPDTFVICESRGQTDNDVILSPDIAVCDSCVKELFTPGNPRFENPFISCVSCGPRFSILKKLPYDRPNTSMVDFELCPLCAYQYGDPDDRRCHAQTVCCNACGPVLLYTGRNGVQAAGQGALGEAVKALLYGGVTAIKGLGGYHLACSPFDSGVVDRLRAVKGREHKPFAVMFRNIEEIRHHCETNDSENALLLGPERPIVLLSRKASSDIAENVSGKSRFIGAFLPYTPLQHLILRKTGPLVMTSANTTGLPIIIDDNEMISFFNERDTLSGVLSHNRAILRRLDDSVCAVVSGRTQMIRRSRGFVPLPLTFDVESGPDILACGTEQKVTACLVSGDSAYTSAEIGDLDSLEAVRVYRETVNDMSSLLGIKPGIAVCDMHPAYESTKYAENSGLPVIKVQHHHAHIASVLAEEAIRDSVIGVAFDGTGYGTDGTVWGGEFLIASPYGFERAGHLKPVLLFKSDEAVRQGWRSAACMLYDAGLDFRELIGPGYDYIKAALDKRINTVYSSSMGRLFDAVSAMLGICRESAYEGQCAIELENAAAAFGDRPFVKLPYDIRETDGGVVADMAPCIREIYRLRQCRTSAEELAISFHRTVADMTVRMCVRMREKKGLNTAVLSGGVFQNRLLLDAVISRLSSKGFIIKTNRLVPPNDGGVSLGQAYIGRLAVLTKE